MQLAVQLLYDATWTEKPFFPSKNAVVKPLESKPGYFSCMVPLTYPSLIPEQNSEYSRATWKLQEK